jgi:hypothetical protein
MPAALTLRRMRLRRALQVGASGTMRGEGAYPGPFGSSLAPELAPNVSIQASMRRDVEGGAYSETLINRDISLLVVTARDA